MKEFFITAISECESLFTVEARDEQHALELYHSRDFYELDHIDNFYKTVRIEVHCGDEDFCGECKPLLVKKLS